MRTPSSSFRWNADDSDISAEFGWSGMPVDFKFSADVVYSTGTESSFINLGAYRELEVSERASLNASFVFSLNEGYVTDGHNGASNFLLQLESEVALADSIALTAYIGTSWAIGTKLAQRGDQQLETFFHGAIGFNRSFAN